MKLMKESTIETSKDDDVETDEEIFSGGQEICF